MSSNTEADADLWADWLLRGRFSNDRNVERALRASIEPDVDLLLDRAQLRDGMTLLDVGSGDGAVALRAIERVGASLNVFVTDISPKLLASATERARERGVQDQCTFLQCSAQSLHLVADASVDAVTTRAVIGYLPDKQAVLREFYRALKPGGRISLAEPIRRDEAFEVCALRTLVEANPDAPDNLFFRLLHRWKRTQFPDTEAEAARTPMTNFSERDLVNMAMQAGFVDIHMEFHIDVGQPLSWSWDALLDSTPLPWSPTLRQLMAQEFDAQEQRMFEQVMRSQMCLRDMRQVNRMAFLSARKPAN